MHIRPLILADLPAYNALRDEALCSAPEAFTSDYASSVDTPTSHYADGAEFKQRGARRIITP